MDSAKAEVLRYLGYKGQTPDAALNARIDAAMAECRSLARPAYTARSFPVRAEGGRVYLEGASLALEGADIVRHLEGAAEAAALAATLGVAVEQAVRRYGYTDLAYALLLDAAATQYIEETCNKAQEEIADKAKARGFVITSRFSPGYGDLGLSVQPGLLAALDAGRAIGLGCTDSHILTPKKSVTAFIGLLPPGAAKEAAVSGCGCCNLAAECPYTAIRKLP